MQPTPPAALSVKPLPSFDEFLELPDAALHPLTPPTVVLGAGGTRRRAALAGIPPNSQEYARWTRQEMMACLDLLFRHGVRHLFAPLLTDSHRDEATAGYSDKVVEWTRQGLTGEQARREYAERGWRVRLVGVESWPALQQTAEDVRRITASHAGPTVWFSVSSDVDAHWQLILATAATRAVHTRAELIRAIYGEEIPPATLYLGTGKPQLVESIVPPLLIGKLECYWRQHLGYDLDQTTLRAILYDYHYIRRTRQTDKTGRAEQILAHAEVWAAPAIVGLGTRIGPFWYPAATHSPFPAPAERRR